MTGAPPLVSVVLPVYNCAQHVERAVRSVLTQTFGDFELLIFDDGSTDQTPAVLARLDDPRIRIFRQANCGLPVTLNKGIALARGRYIARQDADDISLPSRLEKQVKFMEARPECGLLGTWSEIIRDDEQTGRMHRHPVDHSTIAFELLFDSQFVHPSVVMRKAVLDKVGVYSTELRGGPEDYELWIRLSRACEVANLPEPLILYREVAGSASRSGGKVWRGKVMGVSRAALANAAGVALPNRVVDDIAALWHYAFEHVSSEPDFPAMREILQSAAIKVSGIPNRKTAIDRADRRSRELRARHRERTLYLPARRLIHRLRNFLSSSN